MKRIFLILLAIICLFSFGVSDFSIAYASERTNQEVQYATMRFQFDNANTYDLVSVRIEKEEISVDIDSLANLIGFIGRGDENSYCVTNPQNNNVFIFCVGNTDVIVRRGGVMTYTSPSEIYFDNDKIWVPLDFFLKLCDINTKINNGIIFLSRPQKTVLNIIDTIIRNENKYSFSWEKDLGLSDKESNIQLGSSVLVNFWNDFIDSFGLDLFSIIWQDFTMDATYAEKLCCLFDVRSESELAANADYIKGLYDVLSKDGELAGIMEDVMKHNSLNDFSQVFDELIAGIESVPGFENSTSYTELVKKLKGIFTKSFFAYGTRSMQEVISENVDIVDHLQTIFYGLRFLGYVSDFENSDMFSIEALDYFLNNLSDDAPLSKHTITTLKTANNGLQGNVATYAVGKFIFDNYKGILSDGVKAGLVQGFSEYKLTEIITIKDRIALLAWSLSKAFVPFVKNGLELTDDVELSAYAICLQTASRIEASKIFNFCFDNKIERGLNEDELYHLAQSYYVFLKSSYIARCTALDALDKKGFKEDEIRALVKQQEDINDEIIQLMSILRMADANIKDNDVYGLLPSQKDVFTSKGFFNANTLRYNISGKVLDQKNKKDIFLATIEISDNAQYQDICFTSNKSGNFSWDVPAGQYVIRISAQGYEPIEQKIVVKEEQFLGEFFLVSKNATSVVLNNKLLTKDNKTIMYATLTGVDDDGEKVWEYKTEEYPAAGSGDVIREIGIHNEKYYFVECGTVTAFNLADGKLLWTWDALIEGMAPDAFAFGNDDNLYLSGWIGPAFVELDKDGNSVKQIDSFGDDVYWANKVEYLGDKVAITFESDYPDIVYYVNLDDYTFYKEVTVRDFEGVYIDTDYIKHHNEEGYMRSQYMIIQLNYFETSGTIEMAISSSGIHWASGDIGVAYINDGNMYAGFMGSNPVYKYSFNPDTEILTVQRENEKYTFRKGELFEDGYVDGGRTYINTYPEGRY